MEFIKPVIAILCATAIGAAILTIHAMCEVAKRADDTIKKAVENEEEQK